MAYNRQRPSWKDYPDTSTPIRASDLNAIEDGLVTAAGVADTALDLASTAASRAANAEASVGSLAASAAASAAAAQSAAGSVVSAQIAPDGSVSFYQNGVEL